MIFGSSFFAVRLAHQKIRSELENVSFFVFPMGLSKYHKPLSKSSLPLSDSQLSNRVLYNWVGHLAKILQKN